MEIAETKIALVTGGSRGLGRGMALQLERRLGVRLLHRTTRHVSPTLEGQAYYERCHRVLNEVEEAESFLGASAANPSGRLRVDMSTAIGSAFLFPHLGEFCARYPGLELEIGATDRLVDLLRSIEQFRSHQAVNFLSTATGKHSPFEFMVKGKVQSVTLKGRISVTSTEAYATCCLQGLDIIQAPRYQLEGYLASGELVEVLPRFPPPPMPVAVMYPHHRQLAPRVRVFVDWVVERLGA